VAVYNDQWDTLARVDYPLNKLSQKNPSWIEVKLPDIQVTGKFYIHVYKNLSAWVIGIGADDSIPNEHSSITEAKPDGTFAESKSWPFETIDKKKVNWMIRVTGTAIVPE
jgi:hypothetical protein